LALAQGVRALRKEHRLFQVVSERTNKSIIIMAADDLLGVGAIGKEQVFLNDSFGGGWAAVVSWALAAQIWALIWRKDASAFANRDGLSTVPHRTRKEVHRQALNPFLSKDHLGCSRTHPGSSMPSRPCLRSNLNGWLETNTFPNEKK
jgi:hypothetical protein